MNKSYPNKENCSLEELEKYIKLSRNMKEKDRLMSIRLLWMGHEAQEVSKLLMVSDVAVYKWIARFNLKGLEGLLSRMRTGRPRLVKDADFRNLLNVFEAPQKAGEVHWTAKKFHGHLQSTLKIECDYSTVLKYLKKENYVLKYGRSWPRQPEGNEEKRQEHIKLISSLNNDATKVLWFMDESGFDGDPRPRRGWCKKGERKKIYRTQKHLRMNISGMVCPSMGELFALEFPFSDRTTFQTFLDVANRDISGNGKEHYIVLDNASWHKSTGIRWGRFKPIFLPPYSPDLNPIERLWGYIKERFFSSFCAKNLDDLIKQIDFAFSSIAADKQSIASLTKCSSS